MLFYRPIGHGFDSLIATPTIIYFLAYMGSLCSKSTATVGGHQVLGSSTTGEGRHGSAPGGSDTRVAAAEAAERRLQAQQARGTSASNPNKGQLAKKLEATKSAARVPEPKREVPLVWD